LSLVLGLLGELVAERLHRRVVGGEHGVGHLGEVGGLRGQHVEEAAAPARGLVLGFGLDGLDGG
jgi:hypothetical protein